MGRMCGKGRGCKCQHVAARRGCRGTAECCLRAQAACKIHPVIRPHSPAAHNTQKTNARPHYTSSHRYLRQKRSLYPSSSTCSFLPSHAARHARSVTA